MVLVLGHILAPGIPFVDITDPQTTVTVDTYGTYEFTYTMSNGPCGDDVMLIVNFNEDPLFLVTTTDETCFGFCDGTAMINPLLVQQPYLTNPQFPQGNVCPGNYSVTLTDINGCTSTIPYTINPDIELTGMITHIDLSCYGDNTGMFTYTPNGGTGNYTYTWNPTPSVSQTIQNLPAGACLYYTI